MKFKATQTTAVNNDEKWIPFAPAELVERRCPMECPSLPNAHTQIDFSAASYPHKENRQFDSINHLRCVDLPARRRAVRFFVRFFKLALDNIRSRILPLAETVFFHAIFAVRKEVKQYKAFGLCIGMLFSAMQSPPPHTANTRQNDTVGINFA